MKTLRKRGLALFLALVMCMSVMQLTAFADYEPENLSSVTDVQETIGQSTEPVALPSHRFQWFATHLSWYRSAAAGALGARLRPWRISCGMDIPP